MRIDKRILVNLIPGLLPLFIFVIADEFWGTLIALYLAIGFGLIELAFTFLRTRKFEKFILLDISLLVLLGMVSILMEDDSFFKLKPAFIELIFAGIIAFSVFSGKNLLYEMSLRYVRDFQIHPSAQKRFTRSLRIILWITLVHIILVVYSAYFMSKEAWIFISGVLFYLLILGYFAMEMLKFRISQRRSKYTEMLPVVDKDGNVTGTASREDCHFNSKVKILHPVVHLHVMNDRGDIYLQRRAMSRKVQPGKWDTAVGGHISFGENIETSLRREALEELGILNFSPAFAGKYIWETEIERELVFMFVTSSLETIRYQEEEIMDGRFWRVEEIKENLGKEIFTSNFEKEFRILMGEESISKV